MQDRTLGTLGISFSIVLLGGLFFKLIVLPNIPIGAEQESSLSKTITLVILSFTGLFGLLFVGFLIIFTVIVLYNSSKGEKSKQS